jgi:hypothetical protein
MNKFGQQYPSSHQNDISPPSGLTELLVTGYSHRISLRSDLQNTHLGNAKLEIIERRRYT